MNNKDTSVISAEILSELVRRYKERDDDAHHKTAKFEDDYYRHGGINNCVEIQSHNKHFVKNTHYIEFETAVVKHNHRTLSDFDVDFIFRFCIRNTNVKHHRYSIVGLDTSSPRFPFKFSDVHDPKKIEEIVEQGKKYYEDFSEKIEALVFDTTLLKFLFIN